MTEAEELKARGYGEHSSAPLEEILAKKRTVYLGVDPSADSMQAGNLAVVLLMKRLADAGHKIVLLVGGGTGMIGDPRESGERALSEPKTVEKNARAVRAQLESIIGKKITVVNNADWLLKLRLVDFLRDIGKHFTVNELVKRDIIRRRLETPDESISYTEFAYSLLQGYDFFHLYKTKGVDVQIGGSDQWTNLLSGVELIRRKLGKEAHCFTCPLVTDAQGKKFGKSEGNAVWLDPKKTSPFAFYQFWISLPDAKLAEYLKLYTFMPLGDIEELMAKHTAAPQDREAQEVLARLVTEIVHGPGATAAAAAASDALFGGRPLSSLSQIERACLTAEVPTHTVSKGHASKGYPIADALVAGGLASSKSDARRLIEGSGVTINRKPIDQVEPVVRSSDFDGGMAILRKGKSPLILVLE